MHQDRKITFTTSPGVYLDTPLYQKLLDPPRAEGREQGLSCPKVEAGLEIFLAFVPLRRQLRPQGSLVHSHLSFSWLSCAFAVLVIFPFSGPLSSFTAAFILYFCTPQPLLPLLQNARGRGVILPPCSQTEMLSFSSWHPTEVLSSFEKMRGCLFRYICPYSDWIVINGKKLMGFLKTLELWHRRLKEKLYAIL